MNIYDQLKQLWARVTGLEKSGAATDTKISALEAAAVRIPKDYSETETNTGVKWIDGKEIYSRVISITTPTTGYENVAQITKVDTVVDIRTILFDNTAYFCENRHLNTRYNINGNIVVTASTSANLQGVPAWIYIYYTKSNSSKGIEDDEPETKKATKKKTTK